MNPLNTTDASSATPPSKEEGLSSLYWMIGLGVLGGLLYGQSLDDPFHFDDNTSLIDNPLLRAGSSLTNFKVSRYVGQLTFAFNSKLGGLEPFGYHLVNLEIHFANAFLVFFLLSLLWKTPALLAAVPLGTPGRLRSVSFFAAAGSALFLVHPIQSQAVAYVSQRVTALACFFFLATVLAYLQARLSPSTGRRLTWYAVALACTVLAMKTKEHTFTLPFALVLVELALFWPEKDRRWVQLLPFLLTLPIIPLSMNAVLTPEGSVLPRETAALGRVDYLLSQFPVIVTYLRLVVLPVGQNLDHDPTVYRSLWAPAVLLSLLLLLSIGALAIASLRRPKYRLAGLGLLWFFLTLSVESSIIPIADLMYEHRVYLPLVGLIMALGPWMVHWGGSKRAQALVALVIAAYAVACFVRVGVWGSEIRLWSDAAAKSPNKARVLNNLAGSYHDLGRYPEAALHYRTAVKLDPKLLIAYTNLAFSLIAQEKWKEAAEALEAALRVQPFSPVAVQHLLNVYLNLGELEKARQLGEAFLAQGKELGPVRVNLGLVLLNQGKPAEAIPHFERAAQLTDQPEPILKLLKEAREQLPSSVPAQSAGAKTPG